MPACVVLLASDEPDTTARIHRALQEVGHQVLVAQDGDETLAVCGSAHPKVVLLHWHAGGHGRELSRQLRPASDAGYNYLIVLLPARTSEEVCAALAAGADACLMPPLTHRELLLQVAAGVRVVELVADLREKGEQLSVAFDRGRDTIRDVVSVCAYCGKIRNSAGYWRTLSEHLAVTSGAQLSHGYCPECFRARGFDRWLDRE